MNILLISYNYFPYNTPAVYRVHSFAKALTESGHHVHILSSHTHRAPGDPETEKKFKLDIKQTVTRCVELSNPHSGNRKMSLTERILNKIGSVIERVLLPFDSSFLWLFVAFFVARKIVKSESISTVIVSSPPHSTQLLGLMLKKFYGLHLVCDFRDAWTHNPVHVSNGTGSSLLSRLGESLVLKAADTIIANTPTNRQYLEKDYPFCKDKIKVILNGYVEADVPEDTANKVIGTDKAGKFRLVYTGELYPGYSEKVFQALKLLKEKNSDLSSKFVFEMAGILPPEDMELVARLGLNDIFCFHGFVSYQKCIELVQESSSVLLILPKSYANVVGSKLYFYLGQQKHVLALLPEGDAADIIRLVKAGNVFDPDDAVGFSNLLDECLRGDKQVSVEYDLSEWKKLSREHQAGEFVKIINRQFG